MGAPFRRCGEQPSTRPTSRKGIDSALEKVRSLLQDQQTLTDETRKADAQDQGVLDKLSQKQNRIGQQVGDVEALRAHPVERLVPEQVAPRRAELADEQDDEEEDDRPGHVVGAA